MRRLVIGAMVCAVAVGFVGSASAKGDAAEGKKKADPEAMFNKRDKDGDGKLSLAEFLGKQQDGAAAEKKKAIFEKKDKDADGFLTKDELLSKGKAKAKGKGKKKANQ